MTGEYPFRTVMADELATVWPRATLVDVRGREEHATAHVPGSLNIPLDELPALLAALPSGTIYLLCGSGKRSSQAALSGGRVMWHLDELPAGGTIVTYCQSGVRNSVAASALRRAGYDVVELDGSYAAWNSRQNSVPAI
jgi:rhodanese-related sulfurtransferase